MTEIFRAIPAMDRLLALPGPRMLAAAASHEFARTQLRSVVAELKADLRQGTASPGETGDLTAEIERRFAARLAEIKHPALRPVINATGVVLHTNLGRAPLAAEAVEALREIAGSYANLEYDLAEGRRGRRDLLCEELLCELTGAEAALVVNNCAAAVLLILSEVASGGEVIVSRSELVEIGGGFRVPEVLERSGATLHEVGTTNKTRLDDYRRAINPNTKALLRVHQSNFKIIGFTAAPELNELANLAAEHSLPLIQDLGSGCLIESLLLHLDQEPTVKESVQAGVTLVAFSGDKLLGGPQAGVIVGKREWLERLRCNPLLRALRVDKLTYAALEATLRIYREGRALNDIPILKMLNTSSEELDRRTRRLIAQLPPRQKGSQRKSLVRQIGAVTISLGSSASVVGGGSAPAVELESTPITVSHKSLSAASIDEWLRQQSPPIVVRIERDQILFDLRTVRPEEEASLINSLVALGKLGD